jgi:hypothetical protein
MFVFVWYPYRWGVRNLELIKKGSFVCEYVGENLTYTESQRRDKIRSKGEWCCGVSLSFAYCSVHVQVMWEASSSRTAEVGKTTI